MLRPLLLAACIAFPSAVLASGDAPPPPELAAAAPDHWQIEVSYAVAEDTPGHVWTRVVVWVRTRADGPCEQIGAWDADNAAGALRLLGPVAERMAEGWGE